MVVSDCECSDGVGGRENGGSGIDGGREDGEDGGGGREVVGDGEDVVHVEPRRREFVWSVPNVDPRPSTLYLGLGPRPRL